MVQLDELIGSAAPDKETANRAFDFFIWHLNNQVSAVHRVKFLYFPGPGNKAPLSGLQMTDRIYISNNCNKDEAIKTLIHELAHFVFRLCGYKRDEIKVLKIERRLWKKFSEAQKEILWQYIPRKITLETVDHEPTE